MVTGLRPPLMFRSDIRRITRRIAKLATPNGQLSHNDYMSLIVDLAARRGKNVVADADLYCRFLGAFPTLVKLAMLALMHEGKIGGIPAAPDLRPGIERAPWEDDDFDVVEYEWYFDEKTVQAILHHLPDDSQSLISLGVPTIVPAANAAGFEVTLIDRSPSLAYKHLDLLGDHHRGYRPDLIQWDLGKAPYANIKPADVVVMDPPWYLEHYRAWLHTAIAACKTDGLIVIALPQPLTSRSAFFDRTELRTILSHIGPTQIIDNSLSYVTPSFERAVLEGDELDHLARWRRADLALVVKQGNPTLPFEFTQTNDPNWTFRRIGGRIIRTWGEPTDERTETVPVISPADSRNGYRLSNVSRSYLASGDINIVTSGGGAAIVERWGRLPQILDSMQDQDDISPSKAVNYTLPDATDAKREELSQILRKLLRR